MALRFHTGQPWRTLHCILAGDVLDAYAGCQHILQPPAYDLPEESWICPSGLAIDGLCLQPPRTVLHDLPTPSGLATFIAPPNQRNLLHVLETRLVHPWFQRPVELSAVNKSPCCLAVATVPPNSRSIVCVGSFAISLEPRPRYVPSDARPRPPSAITSHHTDSRLPSSSIFIIFQSSVFRFIQSFHRGNRQPALVTNTLADYAGNAGLDAPPTADLPTSSTRARIISHAAENPILTPNLSFSGPNQLRHQRQHNANPVTATPRHASNQLSQTAARHDLRLGTVHPGRCSQDNLGPFTLGILEEAGER
ncbi:hypothetical protein AK830_g12321 [Neonectria ditissima]|uniref:Uncharacterized protein n=1 Tax=Neonectria ditissima TaxID=78410 RepID=A0A0P7AB25_9HYPO|nr:hypothetical protein AK830_g12321 [Neonectria ditissima]